jgi:hypothetical protein
MAKEYIIQTNEDDELIACDSCGCEVPTAYYDWGPPFDQKHETDKRPLCDFCASSMAANYTRHRMESEFRMLRAEIWMAAAAVANYLKYGKPQS